MKFSINLIVSALAVLLMIRYLPGVSTHSYDVAISKALIFGIFNASVKPFYRLTERQTTLLSYGITTLILNIILISLSDILVGNYIKIDGYWTIGLTAVILSTINCVLGQLFSYYELYPLKEKTHYRIWR